MNAANQNISESHFDRFLMVSAKYPGLTPGQQNDMKGETPSFSARAVTVNPIQLGEDCRHRSGPDR